MNVKQWIAQLKTAFESKADALQAVQSAAYMKDHFSFYGVKATERKEIQKAWLKEVEKEGVTEGYWALMYALWDCEEREMQYVAVDWLNSWKITRMDEQDYIHLEYFITHKSWWDTVDLIASTSVGKYALIFPSKIEQVRKNWQNSDDLWLNRTCLLYQLIYKGRVDFDFLRMIIIQYQQNPEFFIQKAIGWSLRQYSKSNPEEVRQFISEINLKGLALREASRYL